MTEQKVKARAHAYHPRIPEVRCWIPPEGITTACEQDPDLWFPNQSGSSGAAELLCMGCEVVDECLEASIVQGEAAGVWGGFSGRARQEMMTARRKAGTL